MRGTVRDPLEQLRWLDVGEGHCPLGEIFSVSFFRGLGTEEVLRRFGTGAQEGVRMSFGALRDRVENLLPQSDGGAGGQYVGVLEAGEWSVAVELSGWEATLPDVAERLSHACEMVAVTRHDYAEHDFVYAVDGSFVTGFNAHTPGYRFGSDPEALNSRIRAIGVDPEQDEMCLDDPIATSFALAAEITGVVFAPDTLERPLLVGSVST
ncbi:hypothetical protein DB35_18005 [Streptomyces abyssalis]|uniref:Uncharacterized protein n=1 Tax=Streptomyces abyssalis TaxID=933944 RepID=A0A1E7JKT6_9ACTN|nr:DUF6461 domain-containing protein [Streptomyces abyssalis]OEU88264.1 hypothetical protein AN215_19165 [Streptomyces abyssalis]OEU91134.1 hypothetical protein DB35_18005 [Streptomyces abyssalis]OEV30845.1 hypothetical protein AN219_08485 [Streptomyces nanshensis]